MRIYAGYYEYKKCLSCVQSMGAVNDGVYIVINNLDYGTLTTISWYCRDKDILVVLSYHKGKSDTVDLEDTPTTIVHPKYLRDILLSGKWT